MPPAEQHKRIIAALFVVISLTANVESRYPSFSLAQTQINKHSPEIDAEVERLSAQLKSSDVEQRLEAALRLSRLAGDAAASALVTALTDASPLVRSIAVDGLSEREDSVVPHLAARLTSDKDVLVRKTAAYALGKFSKTERNAALIAALKDKDPEVRGAAAVSLGDHAAASAIAPLAASLQDKSPFVRAHAGRALGVNGTAATQAVPALIKLLASDEDGDVKRQAAAALGLIGDRSALPELQRAAHAGDSYLAQAARASIRMIEEK